MAGASKAIAPYGASPIFDELSLPDSLRNKHSTKDGTWGLLRVLEGEVELVFIDPPSRQLVWLIAEQMAAFTGVCGTNHLFGLEKNQWFYPPFGKIVSGVQ